MTPQGDQFSPKSGEEDLRGDMHGQPVKGHARLAHLVLSLPQCRRFHCSRRPREIRWGILFPGGAVCQPVSPGGLPSHWSHPVDNYRSPMRTLAILALCILVAAAAAGCGSTGPSTPEPATTASAPVRGEGNPAVYDRMDNETCDELQADFDQSMNNYDATGRQWSLDYADYANATMKQNGCYNNG